MKYIVLIALQISALFIYAQEHVEGKINDQKGLPLIGANIVLENTSIGTTTSIGILSILISRQLMDLIRLNWLKSQFLLVMLHNFLS